MSGFIAFHREAMDHPLFQGDAQRLGAWLWLVARAAWKPTPFNVTGQIITLERGQLCASRSQMAKAWGMSESSVERFLTRLQTEQMIGRATGQGKSIVTICNYSKYQDVSDQSGQATGPATGQRPDSDRTAKEQDNQITKEIDEEAKASPSVKRAKKPIFFVRPDWADPEPWADFMENRRRKRLPDSASAYRGFLADIENFACDYWPPGKLLERAAMKGWGSINLTDEMKAESHGRSEANRNGSPNVHAGRADKFDGFGSALDEVIYAGRTESAAVSSGQSDDASPPLFLPLRSAR